MDVFWEKVKFLFEDLEIILVILVKKVDFDVILYLVVRFNVCFVLFVFIFVVLGMFIVVVIY